VSIAAESSSVSDTIALSFLKLPQAMTIGRGHVVALGVAADGPGSVRAG